MANITQWLEMFLNYQIEDIGSRKWCGGDYNYIVKQYDKTKTSRIARLLGDMNYDGIGTDKNIDTAIEFYKFGIESGDKFAMNNLGYLYERELKDKEKAIEYYMMAISNKCSTAFANLMCLYDESDETKDMIKLCVFWYDTHKTVKPILKYCDENYKFFKEFMTTFSKLCEINKGIDNM
jgi:TPR repeat protein